MKIIIASQNKHKIIEFKRILKEFDVEVISQGEANIEVHAEETGTSFRENAFLKAKAVCDVSNLITIADDSGICIDAFNGEPGIYSSRYLGEDTPYDIKNQIILDKLSDVKEGNRGAQYVCAICCVFPNGDKIEVESKCEGKIGYKSQGVNGFGYDPIFVVNNKSFAEISDEEKDKVSHRGQALRAFEAEFSKYIKEH